MANTAYITLTTEKSTLKQSDLDQLTIRDLSELYQALRFQYDAVSGVLFRNNQDQESKLFLLIDDMQSELCWNMQHVQYEARSRKFDDLHEESYLVGIIFDYQSTCGVSAKELTQLVAELNANLLKLAA